MYRLLLIASVLFLGINTNTALDIPSTQDSAATSEFDWGVYCQVVSDGQTHNGPCHDTSAGFPPAVICGGGYGGSCEAYLYISYTDVCWPEYTVEVFKNSNFLASYSVESDYYGFPQSGTINDAFSAAEGDVFKISIFPVVAGGGGSGGSSSCAGSVTATIGI